ncbi:MULTISPECIES: cytochrome c biogenesis protein CcsA [unclassified Candidatus Frackibacter]|uniref:cytochrome c biogenesis protein CcsA n=1 Tax=unclassified Candidatus Frackibacter TaxID=2648818 RepID=UPI000794EA63|nr:MULTISPECIES: cytochrome c biogenesis protein CcsA [unclassified Candidatus Frackibacter]KXS43793.1 MAG: cytochrome c bioproteinis ABC transporter permease [Candidatus Frackibacter sp. T328-2]SDC40068.1 heme exporter protein C [Candidatus Frackibacter sp. WG11]SEM60674.1 heme exporter protein C [Candidatus Frackibacter sp. WG12]SFL61263.1 heme exporter protein C [Candidatus Frackibacter sp. WG13]
METFDKDNRYSNILGWLAFLVTSVALYMVFEYAPTERVMGHIQRLFYFHVAAAWIAFFAFFVVFVGSIIYLKKRSTFWDNIALASAEIGVAFTTIVLITGPIWARPIWNAWWTWDPRLTTTLILWFIYIAYIILRASADESEKKARFAAIFGIVGFVDVPIVFMSIRWWRTIHPQVIEGGGMNLAPTMVQTLLVSIAAFTFIYFYLLLRRVKVEVLKNQVKEMKEELRKLQYN